MVSDKQFYNQVFCKKCNKLIEDCQCKPIPCPFCDDEFGFGQDWNIHLDEVHGVDMIETKINKGIELSQEEKSLVKCLINAYAVHRSEG